MGTAHIRLQDRYFPLMRISKGMYVIDKKPSRQLCLLVPCQFRRISYLQGYLWGSLEIQNPGKVLISHKRKKSIYRSAHTHDRAPMNMTHDHIHMSTCSPIQKTDIKWHGSSLPLYIVNNLANPQESLRWIQMFPTSANSINVMAWYNKLHTAEGLHGTWCFYF